MTGDSPNDKIMIRAVAFSVAVVVFVLFLVNLDFGFFAALFWALVAGGATLVLLLWRSKPPMDEAQQPLPPPAPVVRPPQPAPASAGAPAASETAADKPATPGPEAAPAAADAKPATEAKPAADTGTQAASSAESGSARVRPTRPLAGQDDVSGFRGEWTYRPAGAEIGAETDAGKPKGLAAPRADGADDLKRIKGIGPKLEQLLNSLGVYHFEQIAAWTDDEIAWVDTNLEGFKGRVTRDNWVKQAAERAAAKPE